MKKYMGNYTNEAAKALKGSERIICRVTDDGAIYVTNGFIAYKMNPPEYAAIVQPVTCCEAGNYTMQNGEKAADNGFDLVKLFNETVEQTANAPRPGALPPDPPGRQGPCRQLLQPRRRCGVVLQRKIYCGAHPLRNAPGHRCDLRRRRLCG